MSAEVFNGGYDTEKYNEYSYKEIASRTDPKKIYIVLLVNGTPRMCSCPDFCFRIVPSNGTHQCKHMKGM